jgi:hypothetical protein
VRAGGSGLGVNDNLDACRCPRCLAVDGASFPYLGMPSTSESYFALVAEVARLAAAELPAKRIGVFAYQITNAPPRGVESLGPNVDVVLCQDISQHFDPEIGVMDRAMSAEWVRKAGAVSFYDYLGIDFWTPRHFPRLLARELRHLARAGVLGYGTHSTAMIDSAMPMFHLLERMLWDVDIDPEAALAGMLQDLYGEASGPVAAFYGLWEERWMSQGSPRWFKGMDDFRAEMTICRPADIERGASLLEEAVAAARDPAVKARIDFLRSSFGFTLAAARAFTAARRAIDGPPAASPDEARGSIETVAGAWRAFASALVRAESLPGNPASGWRPKTFRVRTWALKQEMRDAVLAAAVRWSIAAEGRSGAERLEAGEESLARAVTAAREAIERLVREDVGSSYRLPRAEAVRAATIPRLRPPALEAAVEDWPVPAITTFPWVFRRRPPVVEFVKYDEPIAEFVAAPPITGDLSARWQACWDDEALNIRIVVADDVHTAPGSGPGPGDSMRLTLRPRRDRFEQAEHSWYYLMGGFLGDEVQVDVSLEGDRPAVRFPGPGAPADGSEPVPPVRAAARRTGTKTAYEVEVGWRWLKGFEPAPGRSLGLSIVVTDDDADGPPLTVEAGGGIFPRKRPSEFAAIRLAGR